MGVFERLDQLYQKARVFEVAQDSRLAIFSDLHRGAGCGGDVFAKNEELYFAALGHYLREGYTYIELGDGDELWKQSDFAKITGEYSHIFEALAKLYKEGRLILLYGNHDIIKSQKSWAKTQLDYFQPQAGGDEKPLFPGIDVHEAIRLRYLPQGGEMLLLHGHQANVFGGYFWRIEGFLVRYFWQPLEFLGLQNPFDAAQNRKKRRKIEGRLEQWAKSRNRALIAGHTHRPVFPRKEAEGLYFNSGSGVHTRYVTGLEIVGGEIFPVKWELSVREDGSLYVAKEAMGQPRRLQDL